MSSFGGNEEKETHISEVKVEFSLKTRALLNVSYTMFLVQVFKAGSNCVGLLGLEQSGKPLRLQCFACETTRVVGCWMIYRGKWLNKGPGYTI